MFGTFLGGSVFIGDMFDRLFWIEVIAVSVIKYMIIKLYIYVYCDVFYYIKYVIKKILYLLLM